MRRRDWRRRFETVVDEIKAKPFDWESQHDCGLGLTARLVEAVTGVDHGADYAAAYRTPEQAYRVMKAAGFDSLGDLVASILPEIHPSMARVGDVAAFRTEDRFGYSLGIVNGERVFVLREDGFGTMDLLQADRAFSVG